MSVYMRTKSHQDMYDVRTLSMQQGPFTCKKRANPSSTSLVELGQSSVFVTYQTDLQVTKL